MGVRNRRCNRTEEEEEEEEGHAVAQLVEALRYMPEGRGFDSRWRHCGNGIWIL
jgi:hypothetical protein